MHITEPYFHVGLVHDNIFLSVDFIADDNVVMGITETKFQVRLVHDGRVQSV